MQGQAHKTEEQGNGSVLIFGSAAFLALFLAALVLWLSFGETVIRDMASRAWALCF
jgi:hypothetical protein